jgi:NhaA family Na+:H+ antiporter
MENVSWRQLAGAAMIGGIGFTMSLFIANLAFDNTPALELSKMAILGASIASGAAGMIVLSLQKKTIPTVSY